MRLRVVLVLELVSVLGMVIVGCGGARRKAEEAQPRSDTVTGALGIARLEARREAGVPELVALARGGEAAVAERALRGLGRVGDAAAVAYLAEVVAGEGARAVAAAEALGLSDRPEAEEPLLAAAVRGGEVGRAALWALGRVGTERAAPVLARAVADARDPDAQRVAAMSLGVLGRREVKTGDAARTGLLALARSPDAALRRAAVYGLAFETPPDASPAVLAVLEAGARDDDPEARAVAVAGVGRRKPPVASALTAMVAALGDGDFRVQAAAARGLAAAAREPQVRAALLGWLRGRAAASVDAGHIERAHPVLDALSGLAGPDDGGAAQLSGAWRARAAAAGDDALAAARIDCLLAAAAARTKAWTAGPIDCVSGGLPAHETDVLLAGVLGDGFGGTSEDRMTVLARLVTSPSPHVRAAAVAAAAKIAREVERGLESHTQGEAASWVARGLADPSIGVAGSAADAAGEMAKPAEDAAAPAMGPRPLPDDIASALVERAEAEAARGDVELFASLAGAIASARLERGRGACEAARAHANRSVRAAARDCLRALDDVDPGEVARAAPPAAPPHDPAGVIGRRVRWTLATTRGVIEIDLDPAAAPWHVAAVVALTRAHFYDGLTFHRVVPGFVVQGGDPEGTGWGGPGFVLPGEPSPPRAARMGRGAVGIADAGLDTGGSQFFIMHAHAPHLEGRYTWIGRVTSGQRIAESLLVGDHIQKATVLVE